MSVDVILFFGLALVAIAAAIGMLASQNAVWPARTRSIRRSTW